MPNNAIDNTNLLQLCYDCGAVGFVPSVTYTYNATTGDVVVTDASTLPAGDTLSKIKVQLFDKFGGEVRGTITALAGSVTLSALTLNRARVLDMKVTILTTGHIAADGGVYWLQAAGNVSLWDVQKNA